MAQPLDAPDAPAPPGVLVPPGRPEVGPGPLQGELVDGPPSRELREATGLVGLLLWPLRAMLGLGLGLFAALVSGLLAALLPGKKRRDEDA